MFSSYRQHQNNLLYSQRFYYNNYQYYNDYEKIQQKYKDDLSKINYLINRKSTGTILLSSSNLPSSMSKPNNQNNNKMQIQEQPITSHKIHQHFYKLFKDRQINFNITLFLKQVLQLFFENNYSEVKKIQNQNKKQVYNFFNLALRQRIVENDSFFIQSKEKNSIQIMNNLLLQQRENKAIYDQAIFKLQQLKNTKNQMYLQRWNAFQDFISYFLDHELASKNQKYKSQLLKLFQFASKIRFIIQETLSTRFFSTLLSDVPNLKKLNQIIHPLVLSLSYTNNFFQPKNGYQNKPRILFLNLDGRQTPYNIRNARNMGQNFYYISIFQQPSYYYKKSQIMDNEFESEIDTNFTNICECYSRMLINQSYPSKLLFNNQQTYKNKSKMLLFPLNSEYIRKKYYQNQTYKKYTSNGKHKIRQFSKLKTSQDIFFLFQTIIFEQIRYFNPQMIFVSYNGLLNIKQIHFKQIIKKLTIISNHKICLFPNFIDILNNCPLNRVPGDQYDDQQEEINEVYMEQEDCQEPQDQDLDQLKVRNIQVVKQFMKKYLPLRQFWSLVDHQTVFSNILMFLKISSGNYSMQQKIQPNQQLKYQLGHRYTYLYNLSQIQQFQFINKYVPKTLKSQELSQLYKNQAKIELKENRIQNQTYQKMINFVIEKFFKDENKSEMTKKEQILNYRLQQILQEYEYENSLRFGSQENNMNNQYSTVSGNMSNVEGCQFIANQYFKEAKKSLLLQNLQTYRHRKTFILEQNQIEPINKLKSYNFYLYHDDFQQISLQKYTQVIYNSSTKRFYIINYKSNDDRHLILYGNMQQMNKKGSIQVKIAEQSQRQIQKSKIKVFENENNDDYQNLEKSIKKDIVLVNYSYCFIKNKLYLFWPQKWSIKDQIRHKLLNLTYKPQTVNIMIKIQLVGDRCIYQSLALKQSNKTFVIPRIGCSTLQIQSGQEQFFVFGGIYDNECDLFDIGDGVSVINIQQISRSFTVKPLPKKKQKVMKQSALFMVSNNATNKKLYILSNRLKPKMNYRIQNYIQGNQEGLILISGGYGRQFTNFYNCFSQQSYIFNSQVKAIQSKQSHQKRLIKFSNPIQIQKPGKYYMIINSQNFLQVEERYSSGPKDFYAYEFRQSKIRLNSKDSMTSQQIYNNKKNISKYCPNPEIVSFIDEQYRVNEYKSDIKKIYLYGFNRTIRQKIYGKFWSPQLYILDGSQCNIVHLSLKTQRNFNWNISNFIMPREQDIISICLDQDRLYVLSCSPITNSLQSTHTNSNKKYILYEGNLSNMNQILNRKQIQMNQKFQFKKKKQQKNINTSMNNKKENNLNLKYKTIYAFQQKIYIIGGLAYTDNFQDYNKSNQRIMQDQNRNYENKIISYRQDYILQKDKNKFKLKTRRVQSQKESVEMISPIILKINELFYFYSIQLVQTIVKRQNNLSIIQQNWKLKIQNFIYENITEGKCKSQLMKFYTFDPNDKNIKRIIPKLQQPKFVSISKHQPFSVSKFKEYLEKVVIRLKKLQQIDQKHQEYLQKCQILLKEKNQELIQSTLILQDKFFRDIINFISPQINPNYRQTQIQQLIRDLKILYSLVNKLIIQNLIQKARLQQSSYNQTNSNTSLTQNQRKKQKQFYQKFQQLNINSLQQDSSNYHFIVQDKSSKKVRYIGIGQLGSLEDIYFFRIRFKNDVSMRLNNLNKNNQDSFYYHPIINSCEEIELNDRFAYFQFMEQHDIKNQVKSFKEYKLYYQFKV